MVKMTEVERNQRYESEDGARVMERDDSYLWVLYVLGTEIDRDQFRNNIADDNGLDLVDMD